MYVSFHGMQNKMETSCRLAHPTAGVLNWGGIWQCPKTFLVVTTGGVESWHPVGRGQGYRQTPHSAHDNTQWRMAQSQMSVSPRWRHLLCELYPHSPLQLHLTLLSLSSPKSQPFLVPVPLQVCFHPRASALIVPWGWNASPPTYLYVFPLYCRTAA